MNLLVQLKFCLMALVNTFCYKFSIIFRRPKLNAINSDYLCVFPVFCDVAYSFNYAMAIYTTDIEKRTLHRCDMGIGACLPQQLM